MRFYKILLISFILTLFTQPALSQQEQEVSERPPVLRQKEPGIPTKPFFKINKDLRRIGLDEIRKIATFEFEPGSYRIDPDFRLGYGDTVIVNLWGKIEATHELTIDRDGKIVIPLLGRVNIMGLTLDEARSTVKKELDKKYTNVELDLNIANVQDIRIAVLGNVENPGPYTVSPLCRVVEAVAKAGGQNAEGSLSDIRLIRDGRQVVSFNVYEFIFKADQSKNIRLKHNDTIYVPQSKKLVAIRGDIVYPGIYEAGDSLTLTKVIDTAGGMAPTMLKRKVSVLRINPETKLTETFKETIFEPSKGIEPEDNIMVENEDIIIVTTTFDYTPYPEDLYRVVSISGEVRIPGDYLIKEDETLSSLLKRAGGFKDGAFVQGAVFIRDSIKKKQKAILDELLATQERAILKEEVRLAEAILTQEEKEIRQRALEYRREALNLMASRIPEGRVVIDVENIINGKSDIALEKGDSIYVPPIPDWVLVAGAVYNPESLAFEEGKNLEYYLNAVGGPNRLADKDDIYVIKANGRTESKSTGYGKISRGDIIVVPEKIE